jgi:hypothetical protein
MGEFSGCMKRAIEGFGVWLVFGNLEHGIVKPARSGRALDGG